jgi:hypothetical protein
MALHAKHRLTHPKRTALVAGAALALTGVVAAPMAQAWDNSGTVVVTGGAGCRTQPLDVATFVTFSLANGETASSDFNAPPGNYYRVEFFHIAKLGTSGTATVTCTNLQDGSSYTWSRPVAIQRPRIGTRQSLNLGGG